MELNIIFIYFDGSSFLIFMVEDKKDKRLIIRTMFILNILILIVIILIFQSFAIPIGQSINKK